MAFTLKYEAVRRLPNPMVKINPMKNGTGKIVNLQDRVDKLNKNAAWKKTKKNWVEAGKTVDISRIPKFILEELGLLNIAEDVQRELDEKHCANRIAPVEVFDPALMQPALCIKTSKGEYISINSQIWLFNFMSLLLYFSIYFSDAPFISIKPIAASI